MYYFRSLLKKLYVSRVTGGEHRHTLAAPTAERCYKRNMAMPSPQAGYIYGQGAGAAAGCYRYGLAPMSFNGCELIAVYNALVALGEREDIREIARSFQKDGAVLGGVFGTDLSALARFFRERGYATRELSGADIDRYDEAMKAGDACIFSFWWSDKSMWLHTVMLRRRDVSGGGVLCYNWSSRHVSGPALFDDMRSLIKRTGVVPVQLTVISRAKES